MNSKRGNLMKGLFIVVGLTLFLRFPYSTRPFLNVDEAIYATAAESILAGKLLYQDVYDLKPPLIHFVYAFTFKIFGGNNMVAIRLLALLWVLATTYFLFKLARYLYGERVGCLAALLYAVFSTTYHPADMIAANTELFMVLPLILSAYYFLRGENEKRLIFWFWAGFFCALATLFKQPGIFNFIAMTVYFLSLFFIFKEKFRKIILKFGLVIVGLAIPFFLIGLYFYTRGALSGFIFWSLEYGFRYTGQISQVRRLYLLGAMMTRLVIPNYIFWIFVVVSFYIIFRAKKEAALIKSTFFICLWGFFSILAAGLGGRPIAHYYIQVIPPFAVLAGLGFSEFLKEFNSQKVSNFFRKVIYGFVIFGFVSSIVYSHGIDYYKEWRMIRRKTPGQDVASYIREHSLEGDSIFVWGFFPEIYVLSGRKSASRFICSDFVVGKSPGAPHCKLIVIPQAFELLVGDLQKNQPVFIVDTSPTDRFDYAKFPISKFPRLNEFIQSNYQLVEEIESCLIYKRK